MKKRTIYPEVDSKQVSSEETISERLRREAEEQVRKETLQKEQEINQKINEINASIDERNLEIARISALAKKNEILNRKLEIYSAILEKVLGQKLSDEDLEKMLLVQESGKKVNEERIEKAIQTLPFGNSKKSVFDYSSNGLWYEIGHIVLESKKYVTQFEFSNNKVSSLIRKSGPMDICKDGIVIEKGRNISIIAVRTIEANGRNKKNVYRFYSSSKIIPIQQFLGIANFILHIYQTGLKISKKSSVAEFEFLVYTKREHTNTSRCLFEDVRENIKHLKYKNNQYGDLKSLAIEMYNSFNCSKKKDNPGDLIRDEEEAFKIGIQMEDENQHWIQRLENMGKKDESR